MLQFLRKALHRLCTSTFLRSALIRALRTFAQTAVATIGTTALLSEVDWPVVASASALAALLSLLTSVATGLPEVDSPSLPTSSDSSAPQK